MSESEASFLGTGWSFPPTFDKQSAQVVMVSGEADIRESLFILLCTALGERIMLPEYGCDIQGYVFQNVTPNWLTNLKTSIRQAIVSWEPRIDVVSIDASATTSDGVVKIEIAYVVRLTNARSNVVFPFYYREGTLVPTTL